MIILFIICGSPGPHPHFLRTEAPGRQGTAGMKNISQHTHKKALCKNLFVEYMKEQMND